MMVTVSCRKDRNAEQHQTHQIAGEFNFVGWLVEVLGWWIYRDRLFQEGYVTPYVLTASFSTDLYEIWKTTSCAASSRLLSQG